MNNINYPLIINPSKYLLYWGAGFLLLLSVFILTAMIIKNDINMDGSLISLTMFILSLGVSYWAMKMKIIIYKDHFIQYSFLPAKKIFFKDVVDFSISYGHNGPFSPINMTQIISLQGVKAEINNFTYRAEDRNLLLNLIIQSQKTSAESNL